MNENNSNLNLNPENLIESNDKDILTENGSDLFSDKATQKNKEINSINEKNKQDSINNLDLSQSTGIENKDYTHVFNQAVNYNQYTFNEQTNDISRNVNIAISVLVITIFLCGFIVFKTLFRKKS